MNRKATIHAPGKGGFRAEAAARPACFGSVPTARKRAASRTWPSEGWVARAIKNEQGESGAQFRVDYLKPSGAIGFYYPNWVVVQKTSAGEVHWIIETKGRVWEGTTAKDEAIRDWCQRVGEAAGVPWRYVRINQTDFDQAKATDLAELVAPETLV